MRCLHVISMVLAILLVANAVPTRGFVPVEPAVDSLLLPCQSGTCCQMGCCLQAPAHPVPSVPLLPVSQGDDEWNPQIDDDHEGQFVAAIANPTADSLQAQGLRLFLSQSRSLTVWSLQRQHVRFQV